MKHAYSAKVQAIVILTVFGTIIVARLLIQNSASIFFAQELAHIGTAETVIVQGTSYELHGGTLSAPTQTDRHTQASVLRIAYAQELARRKPILGIEGTDPVTLRGNTAALVSTMSALADMQTSSSSASFMHSLYPTSFLSALADAEEARQVFLAVGSDVNEARYESAVGAAIEAGSADASAFAGAFKTATLSASTTQFSTFGGTISTDSMSHAIERIKKRFQETRARYERQKWCLDLYSFMCDREVLNVSIQTVPAQSTSADTMAQEVRDVLGKANSVNFLPRRDEIVLNASKCMALLPGPYYFLITRPEYSYWLAPALYINEIYFSSTSHGNGPVLNYLKNVHDITLLPFNPMNFYGCPELGSDIAMMHAVINAASVAQTYKNIVPQERAPLLGSTLREHDALVYLRDAYDHTASDSPIRNDIISASLMFSEQSAGLDDLVGQIADTLTRDRKLKESGIPFDISLQTLFLTHSAFPSLFLAQNPSAGETQIALTEPDTANFAKLLDQYTAYSSIKDSVPSVKILHDIRAFYDFEDYVAPGATP